MPFPILLAAAGAALVGYGGAKYLDSTAKMADAQQDSVKLQRKQNDLQAARQKRETIRATRTAYAQAQQAGINQGVAESSGSKGGLGSILSQGNSNISFLDTYNLISDQATAALGRANYWSGQASMGQGVMQLGMAIFGNADRDFSGIFGKKDV